MLRLGFAGCKIIVGGTVVVVVVVVDVVVGGAADWNLTGLTTTGISVGSG